VPLEASAVFGERMHEIGNELCDFNLLGCRCRTVGEELFDRQHGIELELVPTNAEYFANKVSVVVG
jgi:hypothetical protein